MKVFFIKFGFYSPKSVLTPLYEYSQILSEKGIIVTVFVRDNKENIRSRNNLIIRAVCKEYFSSKVTHIIFLLRLIFILKKEKFDIVHIFNFPGVALLPIFCRKKQAKWALDIQTGSDEGTIKDFFYDKLTAFEARFFDKIIILDKNLRDKLFGKKFASNISIIPLGANIERFIKAKKVRTIWQKYGLSEDSIILVYIGDLGKTRELDNMIRAFQIVLKQQNSKIKLVIIGGENKDIERLKSKASNLSIYDQVLFLGKVPYEEVPDYLVNSDIGLAYIPKTKIYDVQPALKTFEYLAASLPVVATNTLGNLEIIKDGINGLIALDNCQDFAEKIIRFLKDSQLRSQIKNNAINSILKYDWENIVNEIVQVYNEV